MLVSRFAYDSAVYGGLVASVASAWYAIRHRERRVEPKIPTATTGRSKRRYLARIAPVLTLFALLGGEWALLSHAHDAVVIDAGPTATREVLIGAEPHAPTVLGWGHQLVINRSARALTLFEIDYDDYQPHALAPGSITWVPDVRFLGPADHPPPDDLAERWTWLTWDPSVD